MNNTSVNVETTMVEEVAPTKKVSYRQDFLKVASSLIGTESAIIEGLGLNVEEFATMLGVSVENLANAKEYFNTQINKTKTVEKGEYKPTEKGVYILEVLISDDSKFFTGKEIAEGSQGTLKANGVSGSIRGLIANGYVESTNDTPKKYKITQQGIDFLG